MKDSVNSLHFSVFIVGILNCSFCFYMWLFSLFSLSIFIEVFFLYFELFLFFFYSRKSLFKSTDVRLSVQWRESFWDTKLWISSRTLTWGAWFMMLSWKRTTTRHISFRFKRVTSWTCPLGVHEIFARFSKQDIKVWHQNMCAEVANGHVLETTKALKLSRRSSIWRNWFQNYSIIDWTLHGGRQ